MLVEEEEAALYTARVIEELRRAGCTGALMWCHGDYSTEIWPEPPLDEARHERSFGLWRSDGSAKPAVSEVAAFAGRSRREETLDSKAGDFIDIDERTYWIDPATELARLYRRYREMRSSST